MPSRRSLIAFLAVLPGLARAQSAPLRIVFPFGAGGAADAVARMLAEQLGAALGRPAIVENRTGAGGRLGAQAVRGAAPDGATLLFAAGAQMVLQPHTDPALGYDPVADFRPVAQVMRFGQVVAVGPDNPARDVQGLLAWYRADAARRSFGSPGIGTGAHFAGMELGRLAGVPLEHVPYRGTPAALPDLQTGRLGLFIASFGEFRAPAQAGQARLLASLDATRPPNLADLPTLSEAGFDIVAPGWLALYAPAGTPDAAVARLAGAVAALRDGPLAARLAAAGFAPAAGGPAELAAAQRAESVRWAAVVRASGFRPG
jgi:tripartite-type tricarboxylate transporter receptor subunit TctC